MLIKLKEYRKQNDLSQKTLAKMINNTPKNISHWENGKSIPDVYILVKLADVFNITVDELLGRKIKYNFYLDSMERDIILSIRKLSYKQLTAVIMFLCDISDY